MRQTCDRWNAQFKLSQTYLVWLFNNTLKIQPEVFKKYNLKPGTNRETLLPENVCRIIYICLLHYLFLFKSIVFTVC